MGIGTPRPLDYGKPVTTRAAQAEPIASPQASQTSDSGLDDVANWLKDCVGESGIAAAGTALRKFTLASNPPLTRLASFAQLAQLCGPTRHDHFDVALHRHPARIELLIRGGRDGAWVTAQLTPAVHEARLLASVGRALREDRQPLVVGPATPLPVATATEAQRRVLRALADPQVGGVLTELAGTPPRAAATPAWGGAAPGTSAFASRVEPRSLPARYLMATVRLGGGVAEAFSAWEEEMDDDERAANELMRELRAHVQNMDTLERETTKSQVKLLDAVSRPILELPLTPQERQRERERLARERRLLEMARAHLPQGEGSWGARLVEGLPGAGASSARGRIDASGPFDARRTPGGDALFLIAPDGTLRCVQAGAAAPPQGAGERDLTAKRRAAKPAES